jgi:hypothetical protein
MNLKDLGFLKGKKSRKSELAKSQSLLLWVYLGKCVNTIENGTVYMKNEFMKSIDENLETGVLTGVSDVFGGKEILKIGGGNKNRYAIVKT